MKLQLERVQLDPDVTIGSLSVDGIWECWTCESPVRPSGVKVPGSTAIPNGSYGVEITFSPTFNMALPALTNVPGFEGVRIHSGITVPHTDGCILVGQDRLGKSVGRSRMAFSVLFPKLSRARSRGEPITIEVVS